MKVLEIQLRESVCYLIAFLIIVIVKQTWAEIERGIKARHPIHIVHEDIPSVVEAKVEKYKRDHHLPHA
jgi:hypothetical protein